MANHSLRQYRKRGMIVSVTILGLALVTVLLAYISFGNASERSDPETIRYVAIINRHGDRSPSSTYPKDPHKGHIWRGGFGALSLKGSRQMFEAGSNLRARYYRLIPSDGYYTKDAIYVSSSFAERCQMSAQSLLAGFMPPLETLNPLPIRWQPIPVNSLPKERDNLIAQKMPCAKYDDIFGKMFTDPPKDLREFNEKHAELYAHLTEHTGLNISNVATAEDLYYILSIQQEHGLELPEWTRSVFPQPMLTVAERMLTLLTETLYMKIVKAGPLLTDILSQMAKKRKGELQDTNSAASNAIEDILNIQYQDKSADRSIALYSGHDITLISLLRALNLTEQTSSKPDYGAALGIELHQGNNDQNDHEVKIVYYFSSEDKSPKTLTIENCGTPCTFTRFSEMIKHLLVPKFEDICKLD